MSEPYDTIERLKDEIASGESSLDVQLRAYSLLRNNDQRLLADEFAKEYEAFANSETGDYEINPELLERVYSALEKCPEPVKEKGLLDGLGDDSMDGIKI